jgi:hypothetical protein
MEKVNMLNYYLFLFFGFLFISVVLSFRILWYVWKVQNGFRNANQRDPAYRKSLYCFQMRFYFLGLIYYLLNHVAFEFHPVFVFLAGLMFIPQIVYNLKRQVQSLNIHFCMYYMIPHFFVFFYFRGCPKNLENLAPTPIVAFFALAILFLSLVVLHLQSVYGSMFFVPRRCLKKQYNYFIKKSKLKKYFQNNVDEEDLLEDNPKKKSGFKNWCLKIFMKKKDDTQKMQKFDDSIEIKKMDAIEIAEKDQENTLDNIETKDNLDETMEQKEIQDNLEEGEGPKQDPVEDSPEVRTDKDLNKIESKVTEKPPEILNETMDLFSEENCMICLGNVYQDAQLGELGLDKDKMFKNNLFKSLCKRYKKNHRMKTPCNHFYHTGRSLGPKLISRMSLEMDGGQDGVPLLSRHFTSYLLISLLH